MADRSVALRFGDPIDVVDLDRICLLPHDGSRNWFVTMAYWDLSRMTTAYTHALDTLPPANGKVAAPVAAPEEDRRDAFETALLTVLKDFPDQEPTVLAPLQDVLADLAPRPDNELAGYHRAAVVFEEDYFGPPLSRAARHRLAAAAGGGRVRVSVPTKVPEIGSPGRPRLGRAPAGVPPRLTANFCHFAMWSSLTLGSDIRNSRLPHRFEQFQLNGLRRHLTSFVIDVRRTDRKQLSKVLGIGQKVVLRDVGFGLVNLMRLDDELDGSVPKGIDFDNTTQTDAIMRELRSKIDNWLATYIEDGPPGINELRTDDLADGLATYYVARRVALMARAGRGRDERLRLWKHHAELMLRGTILIASYEQRRVQQVLRFPIDDFATSFFTERLGLDHADEKGSGRWLRRADRRTRLELSRHVSNLWARFFTDQILVIQVGDELLRLGRDLPFPPESEQFYPRDLAEPADQWLQMLLRRYDHSYGEGYGTQSRIWSVYDDRMNYIVNFMHSRAQSSGLWLDPFGAAEIKALRAGTYPRTDDEPVD